MNIASPPLRTLLLSAVLATAPFQLHAANDPLEQRGLVDSPVPDGSPAAGRLIVKYRPSIGSDALRASILSSAARRANLLPPSSNAARSAPMAARVLRTSGTGASVLRLTGHLTTAEQTRLLTELRADPAVEYAQLDRMMQPVLDLVGSAALPAQARATAQHTDPAVPNDKFYAKYQWHMQDSAGGIRAPKAWETSTGGGVVVAVIDTGILPDHPDLKNNDHILQGYDFITNASVSRRATDGRVPGALDYGDWIDDDNTCLQRARASSWHGTHTAGTIGELTNNGIGGVGAAHDAQILPIRALGHCGGMSSDIADAIVWASGGHVDGVPDNTHPAEVISMSLGGFGSCDSNTQQAINTAVANGSTVVVAAGNDAIDAAQFTPASCSNVITVGATRITGGITFYSNFGSVVDLSGPGGGQDQDTGNGGWDGLVLSTGYSGKTTPTSGQYKYLGYAGTSMASPHVAAVAALVQSSLASTGKTPLNPSQLQAVLKQTARAFPVPPPTATPIGTGIVDATAAMDYVRTNCSGSSCKPVSTALSNRTPVTAQSAGVDEEHLYSFTATAGTPLNVLSYGGSGNVALYLTFGAEPTTRSYDLRSVRPGNTQTLRLPSPQAGTYFIKLVGGDGGFNNVSLMARQ
ncbi:MULTISPECIES: S8 family peptidase [Xanthomonas]|uniref:S8 family peptidase n=1 Tax=Xanthomonas TaxID=338 RepID=UPI0000678C00|nr:S8 family peptidase [Xanthomonas oryzae]AXM16116.1 protease [Xanthomonas oryzae pv. oryzae]AXM19887.1 protease [Xanthomonas oryzae pv. oryzae]AXM23756.1 protease [Xanthomonas oryzae pv. oryzae]AXM29894.1 protease [Xanthomonas oryzae pv. oryzae]AXM35049.1 protease [Xanthomonas oryzae pv. oryzae]